MKMDENEWEKQLKEDLQTFEQIYEAIAPSQTELMTIIQSNKQKEKQKRKRELTYFLCTALLVLVCYIAAIFQVPKVFLIIQVTAIICFPIALFYKQYKERKKKEIWEL